jgi:hypothetical protein
MSLFPFHSATHLIQHDPGICDFAAVVGLEVTATDVVYDGLETPLVGDEVVAVAEVGVGGGWVGVLQAGHARRLAELVVVDEVVQRHVQRRRRTVRHAAHNISSTIERDRLEHIRENL